MSRLPNGTGWVVASAAVALFIAVSWDGMQSYGPNRGYDGDAFIAYAEVLQATGRLPGPDDTYEWANPPAYYLGTVYVQQFARWAAEGRGAIVPGRPSAPRKSLWILLVIAAAAAIGCRPVRPVRIGGFVLGGLAVGWAFADALSFAAEEPWRSGQLIALFWGVVLLVGAGLLAREAWPGSEVAIAVTVALTAAIPGVIRMSVMFHPETQFAALAVLAVWLLLRSRASGWRPEFAVALGIVIGMASLTRQSAAVLAVATVVAALVLGGRRARGFAVVAVVSLALVAGPWWAYQTIRTGNPLQSYLDRPGYMLDRQPRSFFISFPIRDLVVHPYREAFNNELLPRIHADIWSDWSGAIHGTWVDPTRPARISASTQSVLGLGFDLLSIGGLAFFGWKGIRRVRTGDAGPADAVLATSLIVTSITWFAFVVTLVRFPQAGGDPVKSTYILFLAPLFALGAFAAGRALWTRRRLWRVILCTWAVLYAASFAVHLGTAF